MVDLNLVGGNLIFVGVDENSGGVDLNVVLVDLNQIKVDLNQVGPES